MAQWIVELVTQENITNCVELDAMSIEKISYSTVIVDGVEWTLPPIPGMSFARVECVA